MAIAATYLDSNPVLPYRAPLVSPSLALPPEPRSVRLAREFVAGTLRDAGLEVWTAALLVTELATNVVEHVGSAYSVAVEVGSAVRVEVCDESSRLPVLSEHRAQSERGRGLALVDKLAQQWGAEVGGPGKCVWFEVERQPAS
jgi:anti-sigma regulatory factor (Ser/Thr protein kinase)